MKRKKTFLLRLIAPLVIVLVWLGVSGFGGSYFSRIDEVSSNDMATFLPNSAESTRVNDELSKFRDSKTIPATVVFESNSTLTKAQQLQIEKSVDALKATGKLNGSASPVMTSEDEKAAFVVLPLDADAEFKEVIPILQSSITDTAKGLNYKFTGPAVFTQDLTKAFAGIDGMLLLVALSMVFVILLIVYRSPILPIVTLLSAMFALCAAILAVWYLAKMGVVQLNGQVQGILFILVIGAATDYALLYIARYKEELTQHADKLMATKVAWKASWEPIVAAGGTVTLGLFCLVVSDLGSIKSLGPVGGIGVIFAVLSALTFLPAILLLLGRKAFWPRMPKPTNTKLDYRLVHPAWNKIGTFVGRHPRRLWVGSAAILIVACLFMPQLKADGVAQSEFVLGKSEAREGQALLDKHFASGSGSPTYILTPESDQMTIIRLLEADKGVDSVNITTDDTEKPTMPIGASAKKLKDLIRDKVAKQRDEQVTKIKADIEERMTGAPSSVVDGAYAQATANIPSVEEMLEKAYPFSDTMPKTVDGKVMLQTTLKDPADSIAARETIERLRNITHEKHPAVAIGGVSAVQLDTNNTASRDLRMIIPLTLVVITAVLMVLLRSIVAPVVLLLTTLLSFGATLGIAALMFNNVWNYSGADPAVLIYGFVFLVALGIDYNIFLMTRVREETAKLGVRKGTIKALVVTGGVISSAGIVLASTFAALYVLPILFLAQIAFIVAFGVLLDTLVVRTLLVPSMTLEIGRRIWWPSKLAKGEK
jgi:putative drug exporter of the RND superfamily